MAGAWTESLERYAVPCRLRELGLELAGVRAVRLLDVGTGTGMNVAAALSALDGTGADLEVDTFELDPDAIAAARGLPLEPPGAARWLERSRDALSAAPDAGSGGTPGLKLTLHLGDACRTLPRLDPTPRFDAVFLDPFSPAREAGADSAGEAGLFGRAFLREVALRMHPQAILSSFTSAFRVRLALARAGLRVGLGPEVGLKRSGTLASPARELTPLKASVAARLREGSRGADRPPISGPGEGNGGHFA